MHGKITEINVAATLKEVRRADGTYNIKLIKLQKNLLIQSNQKH